MTQILLAPTTNALLLEHSPLRLPQELEALRAGLATDISTVKVEVRERHGALLLVGAYDTINGDSHQGETPLLVSYLAELQLPRRDVLRFGKKGDYFQARLGFSQLSSRPHGWRIASQPSNVRGKAVRANARDEMDFTGALSASDVSRRYSDTLKGGSSDECLRYSTLTHTLRPSTQIAKLRASLCDLILCPGYMGKYGSVCRRE